MARIKARLLQITAKAVLVEVSGKAWLPRSEIKLPPGELIRGAVIHIGVPRRLVEKKGLARRVFQIKEVDL